jgi:hypothetical protein
VFLILACERLSLLTHGLTKVIHTSLHVNTVPKYWRCPAAWHARGVQSSDKLKQSSRRET